MGRLICLVYLMTSYHREWEYTRVSVGYTRVYFLFTYYLFFRGIPMYVIFYHFLHLYAIYFWFNTYMLFSVISIFSLSYMFLFFYIVP